MQAQILDQHGLNEGIGGIRLHGRRLSDERLGLGILRLTLDLVQPTGDDLVLMLLRMITLRKRRQR